MPQGDLQSFVTAKDRREGITILLWVHPFPGTSIPDAFRSAPRMWRSGGKPKLLGPASYKPRTAYDGTISRWQYLVSGFQSLKHAPPDVTQRSSLLVLPR